MPHHIHRIFLPRRSDVLAFLALVIAAMTVPCSPGYAADQAATAKSGSSMGLHGMALFGGREGLYASHMPMYHRPHDMQAVFRLHIEDPAIDESMRRELAQHPALWSIVPERFELDRLAPASADPVKHLRADLVRGHFERGGTVVHAGVDVAVERVLLFRRLDADAHKDGKAAYQVIDAGPNAKEHFLVKRIEGRPDFDHIVPFAMKNGATAPDWIAVERTGDIAEKSADATLVKAGAMRGLNVLHAVYFESDDLQ
jgi:hypothetical protein